MNRGINYQSVVISHEVNDSNPNTLTLLSRYTGNKSGRTVQPSIWILERFLRLSTRCNHRHKPGYAKDASQ